MITQFNGYSVLVDLIDLEDSGLCLLVTEDEEGNVETEIVEVQEEKEESS